MSDPEAQKISVLAGKVAQKFPEANGRRSEQWVTQHCYWLDSHLNIAWEKLHLPAKKRGAAFDFDIKRNPEAVCVLV